MASIRPNAEPAATSVAAGDIFLIDGATGVRALAASSVITSTSAAGGDLTGTYPAPAIAPSAVTNAKMANMAARTVKANNTAGAAAPTDVTLQTIRGMVSVLDFGADPTGVVDSTTAFQNAVNAVSAGGILLIPGSGYNISGTVTIANPMTIMGSNFINSSTGTINATGTVTLFKVTSSYVTFRDLYLNRAGSPTGNCFDVGQDFKTITDASMSSVTNTTTLSSPAQANFTSADVGKYVNVTGAGVGGAPLLATITAVTNSTTATLSVACSTTVSGATAKYGVLYSHVVFDNVQMVNHAIGLNLGDVGEYHVSKCLINCTTPVVINDVISQGLGASEFSGNTFMASAAGWGIVYNSGSDVRVINNKFLGGIYCFNMNWNNSQEGNLIISANSLENYTSAAIFMTFGAIYERILIENNSAAGTGSGAFLSIDNASSAPVNSVIVTGNATHLAGYAGTGISIGKANQVVMDDNIIDFGGAGTGIALLSNSGSCVVSDNILNVATKYTNAGTSNLFDTSVGVAVTNLPTSPANGSRVYATDGVPASNPARGSGTGAVAVYENGAWVCLGPGVKLTNSIGANVTLNNASAYFDGPSVAQGTTGTWLVSGTVTVSDSTGVSVFLAKLWDGTTVVASTVGVSGGAGSQLSLSLSGIITAPAGNLRISVLDSSHTTGSIIANGSGAGKDSTITAVQMG